jgi:hypothetical protein
MTLSQRDALVADEVVRAFGQVLYDNGYDVAAFTRLSATEVRYEQAGATPVFETVRAALATAFAVEPQGQA